MKLLCTCANGHSWEIESDRADHAADEACPVCGALGGASAADHHSGPTIVLPEGARLDPSDVPGEGQRHVETIVSRSPRVALDDGARPTVQGYEILGVLGRGGMGVVYRARQLKLDREVALKMILAGPHVGREMLARFRQEAEAVARLQHPNIVQVYEVGEAAGLPYISLELIGGGSLSSRIAGKPQPPRDAAETVCTLAEAIEFAHRRSILHRDLKPDNVLITASGGLKITDFGLAKRVDGGSVQTMTGDVMGTPAYMAPEQAGGVTKNLGAPCDVYSLGVILYEMLTGRPPLVGQDPVETLMAVLSEEPVPVRRLQPRVPRDLETICLKCLEKLPRRRYPTAQALADDLRRYLRNEPIAARPVSTFERGVKWARRRPATALAYVGAAAMAVMALAGFAWHNQRLGVELANTQVQFNRAEADLVAAQDTIEALLDRVAGDRAVLLADDQLLGTILEFCERLLAQNPDTPGVEWRMGKAHRMRGSIFAMRGQTADAEREFTRAIALLEPLTQKHRAVLEYQRDLAGAHNNLGNLLATAGPSAKAEENFARAIAIYGRAAERTVLPSQIHSELAMAHNNLGVMLLSAGRVSEAEASHRRALDLRQQLSRLSPDELDYQHDLASSRINLGALYRTQGRLDAAERLFTDAAASLSRLVAARPKAIPDRAALASAQSNLAFVQSTLGKVDQADRGFAAAIEAFREVTAAAPHVTDYWQRLASAENNYGLFLAALGRSQAAASTFAQALAIVDREAAAIETTDVATRMAQAVSLDGLAQLALAAGDLSAAEPYIERSLAIREDLARELADNASLHIQLGMTRENAAQLVARRGQTRAAKGYFELAVAAQRRAGELASGDPAYTAQLASLYRQLADSHLALGEPTQAARVAEQIAELPVHEGAQVAQAADLLGRCFTLAQAVKSVDFNSEAVARRTIDLLRDGIRSGTVTRASLSESASYAALRSRPDFQELIAQSGAAEARNQQERE